MKLRMKLVWSGFGIVCLPMILSTIVMWMLIRQDNERDARMRSTQLIESIQQEVEIVSSESVLQMNNFSQEPNLLSALHYLKEGKTVASTFYIEEFHRSESSVVLHEFARTNSYDFIILYDQEGQLISYVNAATNTRILGVYTPMEDKTMILKTFPVTRGIKTSGEIQAIEWNVIADPVGIVPLHIEPIPVSSTSMTLFKEHLALKITIPVFDPQSDTQSQSIGTLIGYKYISEHFFPRLRKQKEAEINFFIDRKLSLGTLEALNNIPEEHWAHIQELSAQTDGGTVYNTETVIEEDAFYLTYAPIVWEDGNIRSTVMVGLSKAPVYAKTHRAVRYQSVVSVFCIVIIIPFTLFMAGRLAGPIQKMALMAEAIAKGNITQHALLVKSKDEVGQLCRSFQGMVNYLQKMADVANSISRGEINQQITPTSDQDVLGIAFQRMTHYLKSVADAAEQIQQGDLTQTVALASAHDVFGRTFNEMIQQIRHLVEHIRAEAGNLVEAGERVAESSGMTSENSAIQAEASEVITSGMQELASNIEAISSNLGGQAQAIDHVRDSGQHIAGSITNIAQKVDELSEFTNDAASAIHLMDSSVQNIHQQVQASVDVSQQVAEIAQQGADHVTRLIEEIQAINEQMIISSEAILRLQRQSRRINEILNVIQEVVEQTNLLALNASIIAAQAGSHGKSFGVVADEVKGLANRTSESTKEITQFTKTIQTELSEAVNALGISANYVMTGLKISQQTEQVLNGIISGAEQSSQLITRIAENVQEHTRINHQVQQATEDVVLKLNDITNFTHEQEQQTTTIYEETARLTEISNEIQRAIMEQSSVAHHSVDTMGDMSGVVQQNARQARQLADLAANLSAQANALLQLVGQFRVTS